MIVENIEARKLINRIQNDIIKSGIDKSKLINDLKRLRQFSIEENIPAITKVLRLTYEHIEAYDTFAIPIPSDEPVDEIDGEPTEEVSEIESNSESPAESLDYMLSLMDNTNNKTNMTELREYRNALLEYAETH